MKKNDVLRIGLSVQGIGMAWCICHKKDGIYIIDDFEKTSTSFEKLDKVLAKNLPIYTNQIEIIKPHIKVKGLSFCEVKTTREQIEPLISSNTSEGKISTDEKSLILMKKVIEEDYLIQERETPAAQALHFGLGELIYQSTRPRGIAMANLMGTFPTHHIDFGEGNSLAKAEIRRRNSRFESGESRWY